MHDIQVKSLLSAEEFLAFRSVCEEIGVSMSSRIRMLIKKDVRDMAFIQSTSMDGSGHEQD